MWDTKSHICIHIIIIIIKKTKKKVLDEVDDRSGELFVLLHVSGGLL